ncbi:fumarylacetoacetate hydrolase family protein [Streptomyces sp. NPDC048665]|uniref:fumarylacetoacetate hydrolase family protein n=1 Tax=Streptomyces sp. NPDC048665 TaxID=3155490 RepID=UPI003415D69C
MTVRGDGGSDPAGKPGKIIAVGVNYADHAAETGWAVTAAPNVFLKAPSAVIGDRQAIVLPAESVRVEHEAELAVVIGRRLRRASVRQAWEGIAGYCCANDVTARDIQHADGLPDYAKSFDTFCPLGPMTLASRVDPGDLRIECLINGELRQSGRTSNMLTSIADLLVHITAAMTLNPGDVVLTGTPAGAGPLIAGDVVSVRITGLGALTNHVVTERGSESSMKSAGPASCQSS